MPSSNLSEIFHSMMTCLSSQLDEGMTEGVASRVATALIRALSERGWDPVEGFDDWRHIEWVVEAYRADSWIDPVDELSETGRLNARFWMEPV